MVTHDWYMQSCLMMGTAFREHFALLCLVLRAFRDMTGFGKLKLIAKFS